MFGIGMKPEDFEDLEMYVHNQKKNSDRDCFLDDQVDDLLTL